MSWARFEVAVPFRTATVTCEVLTAAVLRCLRSVLEAALLVVVSAWPPPEVRMSTTATTAPTASRARTTPRTRLRLDPLPWGGWPPSSAGGRREGGIVAGRT